MNCDSLSLSGERNVFATAIFLILQTLSPTTGQYDTSLENVYDIFLQAANLLQILDKNSQHPVSASAVATWVTQQLQNYRRIDVLIQMSEVDGLLIFFNN